METTMSNVEHTSVGTAAPTAREQELLNKLSDRALVIFFVTFVAFLEFLLLFQLSHPGFHD
jgi:hypothetical protein